MEPGSICIKSEVSRMIVHATCILKEKPHCLNRINCLKAFSLPQNVIRILRHLKIYRFRRVSLFLSHIHFIPEN